MKLIARKPCSFGGEKFYIGDQIPTESVLDPHAQEKWGVLAIVADDAAPTPAPPVTETVRKEVDTMTVVIRDAEGDMPLDLTRDGLQAVVDVLTVKPAEAETIIEKMEDGDALILIHLVDSRKAVKAAAEDRAKALNPEDPEGSVKDENPEEGQESAGDQ